MKVEHTRGSRIIVLTEIPPYAEDGHTFEPPARMSVTFGYTGPSNVWQAVALDNTVIPMIVKALKDA